MRITDHEFRVGEKAVYPARGIAEVLRIEERNVAGLTTRVYVLRLLDTDQKMMIPVSNAHLLGLRPLIREPEVRALFAILRAPTLLLNAQAWNRRYRGFLDKLRVGSIYDVTEVLRDLYQQAKQRPPSFSERRMLDLAAQTVSREIAAVRGQTPEQVRAEIESMFFPAPRPVVPHWS